MNSGFGTPTRALEFDLRRSLWPDDEFDMTVTVGHIARTRMSCTSQAARWGRVCALPECITDQGPFFATPIMDCIIITRGYNFREGQVRKSR
jgi:hypothetical protein